jgi:hypothetical protein
MISIAPTGLKLDIGVAAVERTTIVGRGAIAIAVRILPIFDEKWTAKPSDNRFDVSCCGGGDIKVCTLRQSDQASFIHESTDEIQYSVSFRWLEDLAFMSETDDPLGAVSG